MGARKTKKITQRPSTIISAALVIVFLFITAAPKLGLNFSWQTLYKVFGVSKQTELPGECSVHFLDVGEGDCTLAFCNGVTVMIDASTDSEYINIDNYLDSFGVDTVDCLIITHPHADHMGGVPQLLSEHTVGRIIMRSLPPEKDMKSAYDCVISLAYERDIPITELSEDTTESFGGIQFDMFLPVRDPDDYNEGSIVTKMHFGSYSVLVMGDAGFDAEQVLCSRLYDVDADILRVGHHGSKYSSSADFLRAVSPEYAVISVGSNNYGHPTPETLKRLGDAGIRTLRTDITNGVYINFYNDRFTVNTRSGKEVSEISGAIRVAA